MESSIERVEGYTTRSPVSIPLLIVAPTITRVMKCLGTVLRVGREYALRECTFGLRWVSYFTTLCGFPVFHKAPT